MSSATNSSTQDLSGSAFQAYTDGNFKQCKDLLETLKKQGDDHQRANQASNQGSSKNDQSQSNAASQYSISLHDDKQTRVQQNLLLTEYYHNKGQQPHKLLQELQKLAQNSMGVKLEAAPICQIAADGSQIILGDLTKPFVPPTSSTNSSAGSKHDQQVTADQVFEQSLRSQGAGQTGTQAVFNSTQGGQAQVDSTTGNASSTAPQQINTSTAAAQSTSAASNSGSSSLLMGESVNLNTVLLYNCAAMSYQTQQFGVCLGYLNQILKHLEHLETFLQVKTLFLLLQVLYDLRQCEPAQPIINLLEIKMIDFKHIIKQKQQIKDQQNEPIYTSSTTKDGKQSVAPEEESKSSFSTNAEMLDENVVSKNSICILVGAHLRKHAVSPKNVNLREYELLLNTYKALFKIMQKDYKGAYASLLKANESRQSMPQDVAQLNGKILKPAQQQHLGLLTHTKALLEQVRGFDFKAAQSLYVPEKEQKGDQSQPLYHKSCYSQKKQDEHSKHDQIYQKCRQFHPQFYFNNLGILHLKLRKYRMATFTFSKALRFLEVSQNITIPATSGSSAAQHNIWQEGAVQPFSDQSATQSPHEYLSNLNSQRSNEVVFNFGLALFKDQKYEQAFHNFEKVSNLLKFNPKLWYYMGLSVLHLNKQKQQELVKTENEVYHRKHGFNPPAYAKAQYLFRNGDNQLKRFQLTPSGDNLAKLHKLIQENEQEYLDSLKITQTELTKTRHRQISGSLSKAQLKKQEKAAQQAWQQTNTPKDSTQLQNAIMYLQNALVAIQNEISNESRYTLLYKFISRSHIMQMQHSYNEAHAKTAIDHLVDNEAARRVADEASADKSDDKKNSAEYDEGKYVYPLPEFPTTHTSLTDFNKDVKSRIEKKYETLIKNVHFYLCFAFLEIGDYINCIKHGSTLLDTFGGRLSDNTEFTTVQYLAEAHCMLGEPAKALGYLDKGSDVAKKECGDEGNSDISAKDLEKHGHKVEQMANRSILSDKLDKMTISLMNKTAVHLCNGDLMGAKDELDKLLMRKEVQLVTTEVDSSQMVPSYLVSMLIYFFLKSKNFRMARHLVKNRRFLLDTNHIDPSHLNSTATGAATGSTATVPPSTTASSSSGVSGNASQQKIFTGATSTTTSGKPAMQSKYEMIKKAEHSISKSFT